jgi:preprotein translocase subunit SecD
VKIVPGKNRIQVTAANIDDLKMMENLIIHKGKMAFYETYTRTSLKEILQENSQFFTLLPEKGTNTGDARIGCVPAASVEKIDEFLKTIGSVNNCLFAWDNSFEDKEICLFALKTNNGKGAVITGSDIESVSCNQDQTSKVQEINVTLKQNAVELWADVTRRNLNHAIAIVLDGKVLAAPVVRSEITGGKCIITGNYTETESKYIAALGNNGELPLNFKIVK